MACCEIILYSLCFVSINVKWLKKKNSTIFDVKMMGDQVAKDLYAFIFIKLCKILFVCLSPLNQNLLFLSWALNFFSKQDEGIKDRDRNVKRSLRDSGESNQIKLNVIWPECAQPSAALYLINPALPAWL